MNRDEKLLPVAEGKCRDYFITSAVDELFQDWLFKKKEMTALLATPPLHTNKVLVAEDDYDLRETLEFGFQRKGFEVLTAANGLEALDYVTKHHIDILVTDVRMPKMTGPELIDRIKKERSKEPPIILCMSGFSDLSIQESYVKGADAFFIKPVSCQDLVAAATYFINLKEEKRQSKALLETHKQQLVLADKMASLGEMASGIAHEINNPLSAILSYSDLLISLIEQENPSPESFKEKSLQYTQRVHSTALMIEKIVQGLRNFSRDSKNDPFVPTLLDSVLHDSIELCRGNFRKYMVEFITPTQESDAFLECRPSQICQVIVNLLKNACEAVESLPERWVDLKVFNHGDTIEIAVTDSGKGIPVSLQEKILEPFFTTKPLGQGTGLGLSISKKIIEAHHGEFFIDTQSSHTRFVVKLPKRQPSEASH